MRQVQQADQPMNKNRIQGAAEQGERAKNREALLVKAGRRKRSGKGSGNLLADPAGAASAR
jgi:hypothetical protein